MKYYSLRRSLINSHSHKIVLLTVDARLYLSTGVSYFFLLYQKLKIKQTQVSDNIMVYAFLVFQLRVFSLTLTVANDISYSYFSLFEWTCFLCKK